VLFRRGRATFSRLGFLSRGWRTAGDSQSKEVLSNSFTDRKARAKNNMDFNMVATFKKALASLRSPPASAPVGLPRFKALRPTLYGLPELRPAE